MKSSGGVRFASSRGAGCDGGAMGFDGDAGSAPHGLQLVLVLNQTHLNDRFEVVGLGLLESVLGNKSIRYNAQRRDGSRG
ncbi:MAG: hypothetical protein IIB54_05770 [Planctomycetes bacterium]|nr:hypothetical protein [Planctomycetota bacterium]